MFVLAEPVLTCAQCLSAALLSGKQVHPLNAGRLPARLKATATFVAERLSDEA